jgi:hypothetical protein
MSIVKDCSDLCQVLIGSRKGAKPGAQRTRRRLDLTVSGLCEISLRSLRETVLHLCVKQPLYDTYHMIN